MAQPNSFNMDNFSIENTLEAASHPHYDAEFGVPLPSMHDVTLTELFNAVMRLQDHQESDEQVDFNVTYQTRYTVGERVAQTDHRRNWAASLLMSRQVVFHDR